MNNNSDLTFFTNDGDYTLLDRFKKTLQDTHFFDVLVGYFYTSGFYLLVDSLKSIEKIRILVGINTDKKTKELIETSHFDNFIISNKDIKDIYSKGISDEMDNSDDSYNVERGVNIFIEFIKEKKLEIRIYPDENIHSKLYIFKFNPNDRDFGRIITGSSNFTYSGLKENIEFNVELKNKADVDFAIDKFEKLWEKSIEISDEYINTIKTNTWLNDEITPYEIYLKCIYEYLKEDINIDEDNVDVYLPEGFTELKYQKQAVISAKKILDAYNGVFIGDVVGLGKTFIAALLAKELKGKKLVICPPVLKEYWEKTFFDFGVQGYKVESLGKLESILNKDDSFDYIFIDEAHHFRNESTKRYENIYNICFGKKVILISATPINNTIYDIYPLIKLFQIPYKSTIPGIKNIKLFFDKLRIKADNIDKNNETYIDNIKEISKEVREKVLRYIMIRRTRTDIVKYFDSDIKKQGLSFPEIENPNKVIYEFDDKIDKIFIETIESIKKLTYSRYIPMDYLKKEYQTAEFEFELQQQKNLSGFMKSILIKRLESSFFAFKQTVKRFIISYSDFIDMFEKGTVYISKKIDVYEYLAMDNEEELIKLEKEGYEIKSYQADEFTKNFIKDLKKDLNILQEVSESWEKLDENIDPKLNKLIHELKNNEILIGNKFLIFTESKETGEYLYKKIEENFKDKVIFYCSSGGLYNKEKRTASPIRELIKQNFDPNEKVISNNIDILITTDVLSEGTNLHRSNIIINYDLPWNPTKILQRVGRVNRVGTKFDKIHIFNFFPTKQTSEEISLEQNIIAKIQAFHDALGNDAKYLTEDEEVGTFGMFGKDLYNKLSDKKNFQDDTEEENYELKYLNILRDIRDNNSSLFDKIKKLPKKARSCRDFDVELLPTKSNHLVSFIRKGMLKKFFISNGLISMELTFLEAIKYLECTDKTIRKSIPQDFYEMLYRNKNLFHTIINEESEENVREKGRSNEKHIIDSIKSIIMNKINKLTDDEEEYLKETLKIIKMGVIPKSAIDNIKKIIEREEDNIKIYSILKQYRIVEKYSIDDKKNHNKNTKKEIILSEYLLTGDLNNEGRRS